MAVPFGRVDVFESEFAIHGDCIFHHRLDGVKAHAFVADQARLGDDFFCQQAAETVAAKLRAEVKALHFADR